MDNGLASSVSVYLSFRTWYVIYVKTDFFNGKKPRIFGHRGASGNAPENTIPSFEAAYNAGAEYFEMDVHSSKDGEILVIHDETVDRTTDGCGFVKSMTVDEIKKLDAGFNFSTDDGKTFPFRNKGVGIPTLLELLRIFPDNYFNIEIKQQIPDITELVINTVRKASAEERVLLASENDLVMLGIREKTAIPTSLSHSEAALLFSSIRREGGFIKPDTAVAVQIPEFYNKIHLISYEAVNAIHRLGMEVHVWTVNEMESIEKLLKIGVDGIISDYPERVKKTVKSC